MLKFPITDKVSKEDLEWFAHLCIYIGIPDKRALDTGVIDNDDWLKMMNIMETLVD